MKRGNVKLSRQLLREAMDLLHEIPHVDLYHRNVDGDSGRWCRCTTGLHYCHEHGVAKLSRKLVRIADALGMDGLGVVSIRRDD